MNPRDLIRIARQMASGAIGQGRGRPRQTELRRAISAAYYALFHALALCCANRLAGPTRNHPVWIQTYRALEHGHARNQCDNQTTMGGFPQEIQNFGRSFVLLQGQRQRADYAPEVTFSRGRVLQLIDEAEAAMEALDGAPAAERRSFALHVLMRRTRE